MFLKLIYAMKDDQAHTFSTASSILGGIKGGWGWDMLLLPGLPILCLALSFLLLSLESHD